ncbi:hypothetical protein D3C86_1931190 [compost metagenome]
MFLRRVEPLHGFETVRQALEYHQAEQDHGCPFDQEHPLPAAQPAEIMEILQNGAGQRPADNAGHGHGNGEQRRDLRPAPGRVPAIEKHQYPWEETGFGHAEQEAQDIETAGAFDP